jgi:hypothetical protein
MITVQAVMVGLWVKMLLLHLRYYKMVITNNIQ